MNCWDNKTLPFFVGSLRKEEPRINNGKSRNFGVGGGGGGGG